MAATVQDLVVAQKRFNEIVKRIGNDSLEAKGVNDALQDIMEGRVFDELVAYRQIKGLIVIGPREIEKAFTNHSPLDLKPGWCPRIDVPWFPGQMRELVELCKTPEWDTKPVLWLSIPSVASVPTNLARQYYWWGVQEDGHGPGIFRSDVMKLHEFIGLEGYDWAYEPATKKPTWKIGYELPRWSTNSTWEEQKGAAEEHGLIVSAPASDALMMNLVKIATGDMLRHHLHTRTNSSYKGQPISTWAQDIGPERFVDYALQVSDSIAINAEYRSGEWGLAVEGLPSEISGQ